MADALYTHTLEVREGARGAASQCKYGTMVVSRSFKDDGDFIHVYDYYLNTFSLLILFMYGLES